MRTRSRNRARNPKRRREIIDLTDSEPKEDGPTLFLSYIPQDILNSIARFSGRPQAVQLAKASRKLYLLDDMPIEDLNDPTLGRNAEKLFGYPLDSIINIPNFKNQLDTVDLTNLKKTSPYLDAAIDNLSFDPDNDIRDHHRSVRRFGNSGYGTEVTAYNAKKLASTQFTYRSAFVFDRHSNVFLVKSAFFNDHRRADINALKKLNFLEMLKQLAKGIRKRDEIDNPYVLEDIPRNPLSYPWYDKSYEFTAPDGVYGTVHYTVQDLKDLLYGTDADQYIPVHKYPPRTAIYITDQQYTKGSDVEILHGFGRSKLFKEFKNWPTMVKAAKRYGITFQKIPPNERSKS